MRTIVLQNGWMVLVPSSLCTLVTRLVSASCEDGKIFIEPQGICVMAGIGHEDAKPNRPWIRSVNIWRLPMALYYCSAYPYHLELGEISSYPPGYKENW